MAGLGKLAGWRWIFILEGLASILIAIFAMCILPENLSKAKFFTEEEREFASLSPSLLFSSTLSCNECGF
jgi:predicted MFS family arabinose efflux permease